MPKRGLTLGKFAPLHAGHQWLLHTAACEMDEVLVLIYDCPEVTSIPLPVRAGWIRQLYPRFEVREVWGGPSEVGDTPRIKRLHEDYILHTLGIRDITHFYSSEFYGEHMSQALGAVNRVVDAGRHKVPISGTAIRTHPFAQREFLHPLVYRDLVSKIVFLGAPSTGKSTLAQRLAQEYQTTWMPEYGREYWETHHVERRLTSEQLVEIAEEHARREEALIWQADKYLFVDTNPLTTRQFALDYHGFALPRLEQMADAAAARYDLVFLCDIDIPYDDTPCRSGEVKRDEFQKQIVADLKMRRIPYLMLRGNLETRVQTVQNVLKRWQPFGNVGELCHIAP